MTWEELFKNERAKPYYKELIKKVNNDRLTKVIYPKEADVFNAFKLTAFNDIKVVIIGQDPYHQPNQAHGLAFSSLDRKTPKSLGNIKKELLDDLNVDISHTNDLTSWAKEGVLLLNTILTVEASKPLSHQDYGWENFTLNIFKEIAKIDKPLVFILWGNNARRYKKYISNKKHLVIESVHPSPLSAYRGFFGSKPFSKTNNYLIKNNIEPINFNV